MLVERAVPRGRLGGRLRLDGRGAEIAGEHAAPRLGSQQRLAEAAAAIRRWRGQSHREAERANGVVVALHPAIQAAEEQLDLDVVRTMAHEALESGDRVGVASHA